MSPESYAKSNSEHAHQVAVFIWAQQNKEFYPELRWLFAIPNGGQRNIIVAASLKAEGVKAGVSDLFFPVPRGGYSGFFIEMKKPNSKESKEQIEFGAFVKEQGYLYACFDHWERARDGLIWYLTSK